MGCKKFIIFCEIFADRISFTTNLLFIHREINRNINKLW